MTKASFLAPDGDLRCTWSGSAPEFLAYHDTEWGFPVADDRRLFEKLSLEGFQAGLSWRTILAKRESFRAASMASTSSGSRPSPRPTSSACSAMPASSDIAARSRP